MENHAIIAAALFAAVYALLILEKVDRAVLSMAGAALAITLGILTQEAAVHGIDFNTLGLLVGMMIIVNVSQKTGMFQYLAVKSAKLAKGDPWHILLYLSVVTALLSALLDNVTTVLLVVPVTLLITDELKVNPYPFLFAQIFASNIGGTATLIGDPPNIMIGSAKGFTFMDFILNVGPATVPVMAATLIVLKFVFAKSMNATDENRTRVMELKEKEALKNGPLLIKCLAIIGLVIAGFLMQRQTGIEPATTALCGAAVLLLITGEDFHSVAAKTEWTTIFFFIGLFVLVHGLVETGVIGVLAKEMLSLTGGSPSLTAYTVLWASAIFSAFVDNIPFVATMIPLVTGMEPSLGGIEAAMPVWWALSLGACLGGNGTIIGASANVIVAGLAARSGTPIKFSTFLKLAFPLMLLSILISHIYLYIYMALK